jgi:S-adenosylmethionine:tRNA ribosyltransferase-isomerase
VRIEDFDYRLPPETIAQRPAEPRDAARLLVDRGPHEPPVDRHVRDLPDLLRSEDLLVVNDSRVLPVRLRLRRESGGAVEALLLEPIGADPRCWECLLRPARRLRPGEMLHDADGTPVLVLGERTAAGDTFQATLAGERDPIELLEEVGEMPLPPYLTQPLEDPERYQTVYATTPGSVAAPTAGLHFTPELMSRLDVERVTLHVGLDTFRPLAVDRVEDHPLHGERYEVAPAAWERIRAAERVLAVGTTTVRVLETLTRGAPLSGRTTLFVTPGFEFRRVDALLTNFHLPRSTLLALVMAFAGTEATRRLYRIAVEEKYRFYSFGDAMLLL